MPPTQQRLDREADRLERFVASREVDSISSFRRFASRYLRMIQFELDELLAGDGPLDANDIVRVEDTVAATLIDAGLPEYLNDYDSEFPALTGAALGFFVLFDFQPTLTTANGDALEASRILKGRQMQQLIVDKLGNPIRDQVFAGIQSGRPKRQIEQELRRVIREGQIIRRDGRVFTDHNTEVFISDSYMQYEREVTARKAEETGLTEFVLYAGPVDQRNSPQCRAILRGEEGSGSRVWRRENFTTDIHPALRADPLIFGGHPNCRHDPKPIDRETAISFGWRP